MDATKITCRRCKGSGLVASPVVYAGIPGGCYKCDATGECYKDKFSAEFINKSGEFYGFTVEYAHGLFVNKNIARCTEADLKRVGAGVKVTKITENQARKFFERYGVATTVKTEKEAA